MSAISLTADYSIQIPEIMSCTLDDDLFTIETTDGKTNRIAGDLLNYSNLLETYVDSQQLMNQLHLYSSEMGKDHSEHATRRSRIYPCLVVNFFSLGLIGSLIGLITFITLVQDYFCYSGFNNQSFKRYEQLSEEATILRNNLTMLNNAFEIHAPDLPKSTLTSPYKIAFDGAWQQLNEIETSLKLVVNSQISSDNLEDLSRSVKPL